MKFDLTASLALVFSLLFSYPAHAIVVDGDLTDWGIHVANNNGSDFSAFLAGAGVWNGKLWKNGMEEDQGDNSGHGGFLGPNHGGQDFDAEFIGVVLDGDDLFISIVTGQRPDNGFSNFEPGDIWLQLAGTVFGIEVGGGVGNTGATSRAFTEGDAGTTYSVIAGSGYVSGVSEHTASQTAGSLWKDPSWISDPIDGCSPNAPAGCVNNRDQVQIDPSNPGKRLGLVDYAFLAAPGSQHSVIELSMSLATLVDAVSLKGLQGEELILEWHPSCGNDEVSTFVRFDGGLSTDQVPSPATLALLLAGFLGRSAAARLYRGQAPGRSV